MNVDLSGLLPDHFSPASRVWIYQADRPFTDAEKPLLDKMIQLFIGSWRTHGAAVSGFGKLLFDRFIVLIADETAATVSGCSTDSSVQLIREIEKQFVVGMFDRQKLAFIINEDIKIISLSQLKTSVQEAVLKGDNLFFNNTVTTLHELRDSWILPAGNSWLQHRPAFAPGVR